MDINVKITIALDPSAEAGLEKLVKAFGRPQAADLDRLLQAINGLDELKRKAEERRPDFGKPAEFKSEAGWTDTGETLDSVDQVAETPAPPPAKEKRSHKKKEAPKVEEPLETGETYTPGYDQPSANGLEIGLETIQELSRKKAQAGKAKGIKTLLADLDLAKISHLQPKDYAAFYSKLEAL